MAKVGRACLRWGWVLLALCAICGVAPRAHAQRARVGVVAQGRVAPALQKAVVRALRQRYQVTTLSRPSRRGGSAALQRRIRKLRLQLLLVVRQQRDALVVQFFEAGGDDSPSATSRLEVRGGKLATHAQRKLLSATDEQLSRGEEVARTSRLGRPSSADPNRAEAASSTDLEPSEIVRGDLPDASGDAVPDTGDSAAHEREPAPHENGDDASGELEGAELQDAESASEEQTVELALSASLGASGYSAELRDAGGAASIDGGGAFALGLGAGLVFGSPKQTRWTLQARYYTSVGRKVDELHRGGPPQPMGLRTHRFEADLGLRFALGDGGWALGPALGYALRGVAPEVHFQNMPFYTLGGPYLRLQLSSPAFGSHIGFRLAPELQWLPQASARVGGATLTAARFALGGQLAAFYRLSPALDFEVSLHESHAFGQAGAPEIDDMHRFILASAVWRP